MRKKAMRYALENISDKEKSKCSPEVCSWDSKRPWSRMEERALAVKPVRMLLQQHNASSKLSAEDEAC